MLVRSEAKKHWVSDARVTHCAFTGCGKQFGMRLRRHHCRMCGFVFCDAHSARRLRLGSAGRLSAAAEPVRVCEGCFQREQVEASVPPPPPTGVALRLHIAGDVRVRDLTATFRARRARKGEERRRAMVPLVDAYARLCLAHQDGRVGLGKKKVVEWESDRTAAGCGVCHRGFTSLLRKHHCRLCGLVVCGDCSAHQRADPPDGATFTYRACSRCAELFSVHTRAAEYARLREMAAVSPLATIFASLSSVVKELRTTAGLFEEQVLQLGTPLATASVADAQATQRRLGATLALLVDEFKKFASVPVAAHEAVLKAEVKRSLDVFRQEMVPRYHSLKRQLDTKAEQKTAIAPTISPPPPPPLPPPLPSGIPSERASSAPSPPPPLRADESPDAAASAPAAGLSCPVDGDGSNGLSSAPVLGDVGSARCASAVNAASSVMGVAQSVVGGVVAACAALSAANAGNGSAGDSNGPIELDEYLHAKRVLIELSRSSMLYAKPQLADVDGLSTIKQLLLQQVRR